jgi:hypothetical protein
MRTAQPTIGVMIAESAAMSKPREGQLGIGRRGWLSRNSFLALEVLKNGASQALARNLAQ